MRIEQIFPTERKVSGPGFKPGILTDLKSHIYDSFIPQIISEWLFKHICKFHQNLVSKTGAREVSIESNLIKIAQYESIYLY